MALAAVRRQREARLVGDEASHEIYNLDDEDGLAMQEAVAASRQRVLALCEQRRNACSVDVVVEDLIKILRSFLSRCGGFISTARGVHL